MRHYFEFDGVKSSDFGVFISGAQTMGAAGRDVDEIVVPGRDGNLTIDNGRFNAVAHTYPAFIAEDAKEGLKGLRNALLSKRGHKRLSDTVHPDEFYRAYYEHGLEPELTANLRHSELEIEFTRDPRRFLVSGDTPQDVSVTTETLSGSVVTFDNETGADRITGLSVSIMAVQSGSGDPSPTNIRPITGWTGANVTRCGKNLFYTADRPLDSGNIVISNGIVYVTKSPTSNYSVNIGTFTAPITGNYIISGSIGGGNSTYQLRLYNSAGTTVLARSTDGDSSEVALTGGTNYTVWVFIYANQVLIEKPFYPMLRLSSVSDGTFEPYNGASYPITWSDTAGTVYGGTLDVVRGKLTVTHKGVTFDGTQPVGQLSNYRYRVIVDNFSAIPAAEYADIKCDKLRTERYNYINTTTENVIVGGTIDNTIVVRVDASITDTSAWNTWASENKPFVVYKLATPLEYDLTPTEIEALLGQNNVWADCGDVSVTLQLPSTLINPTLFPSSPKIRVHGQGTLYIGNTAITVGGSFPYVDIDTEIADCSYEGQNANQYVTFSGLDFPKLEPGENYVTYTGFSDVEITPRWWRL